MSAYPYIIIVIALVILVVWLFCVARDLKEGARLQHEIEELLKMNTPPRQRTQDVHEPAPVSAAQTCPSVAISSAMTSLGPEPQQSPQEQDRWDVI